MEFNNKIFLQIDWSDFRYAMDDIGKTIYTFPVHIRILIGVTILFILIVFVLLGIILSSRIYKTKRQNKRVELQNIFQPILKELLFNDEQDPSQLKSSFSKDDLHIPFHRFTLLEELIHLHENFTGETAERLEKIYAALDFEIDSREKLKSKRWYIIAKGMKELAIMNVRTSYTEISKFINSKNDILRMETRIALMKLSDKEPLAFLTKETEPLSDWDSANIYNMLTKMPEHIIPDFSHWLNSTNKDIVLFCIQMIGRFRQRESVGRLLLLLDNKDDRIKIAVIKALRELNSNEGEDILLKLFPLVNNVIQNEILKTLEVIGSEKSISFLEKIIQQPIEDYPTSIQAIRTMLTINKSGESYIARIFEQSGPQLRLMIQHARDRRL